MDREVTEIQDKKKIIYTELDENKEFKELPFRYVGDNSYLVVYQIYSYNDIWSKLWMKNEKNIKNF